MTDIAEKPRYFTGSTEHAASEYLTDRNKPKGLDGAGRPLEPQEGDVYCDRALPPELRYVIALRDTDQTAHATHVYKDGDWTPVHDGKFHVALDIPNATHYPSPTSAAHRAVQSALYSTSAGRLLSNEAQRELIDAVLRGLGLGDLFDRDELPPMELDLEGNRRVRDAVLELVRYRPGRGYPDQIGDAGAKYDGVGFAENAEEYTKLLNGDSDGFGEEGDSKPARLLSQAVTYAVIGSKDEGRSFAARLNELLQAVGIDEKEIYE